MTSENLIRSFLEYNIYLLHGLSFGGVLVLSNFCFSFQSGFLALVFFFVAFGFLVWFLFFFAPWLVYVYFVFSASRLVAFVAQLNNSKTSMNE